MTPAKQGMKLQLDDSLNIEQMSWEGISTDSLFFTNCSFTCNKRTVKYSNSTSLVSTIAAMHALPVAKSCRQYQ